MRTFKLVRNGPGRISRTALPVSLALITACGHEASLPVSAGFGPAPTLPAPQHALIPTINVVDAIHWSVGQQPTQASGLSVAAFATGRAGVSRHPRRTLPEETRPQTHPGLC